MINRLYDADMQPRDGASAAGKAKCFGLRFTLLCGSYRKQFKKQFNSPLGQCRETRRFTSLAALDGVDTKWRNLEQIYLPLNSTSQ